MEEQGVTGQIRVGIGGWTYEPWRETFYPAGHPKARELEYASARVTAIEINGTFYSRFKPESWRKWRDAAPDGFQYAVKASRFCTNRRVLAEAGESIGRFLEQGLTELGDKLGPILWQLAATKPFDAGDIAAFLALLPEARDGVPLRHVIEPRHESFRVPEFIALARAANVAVVFADGKDRPVIADPTADFLYARLQGCREELETGYAADELDRWASVAKTWEAGGRPGGLDTVTEAPADGVARDVYMFFISGAKVRAPGAAQALIGRL